MKKMFLLLIFPLLIHASENGLDQKRLDTFLKECSNYSQRKTYHLFPCELEAKKLKEAIADFESEEEQADLQLNCKGEDTTPSVGLLPRFVQDIKKEMTCSKRDKEDIENKCSADFQCNGLRALNKVASRLPGMLERSVLEYSENKVKKEGFPTSCLSADKSDCLTEIWTAFVANLYDTASSLWSLAKAGVKSVWNLKGFFNKKADDLHVASVQTKEDITDFWHSPGKWMAQKIQSMKNSVDDFIRQSVFCQKWSGKPHLSKCLKPLENYACIECSDKLNAFCTATGVLSSELGLVFFTAGVGNVATLVGKAGAKVAVEIAAEVAAKVRMVSPEIKAMQGTHRVSKMGRLAAKGRQIGRVFLGKVEKAKDVIGNILEAASKTTPGRLVAGVGKITTIPLKVFDEVSMMGLRSSDRLMAKIGTSSMRARAKRSLVAHSRLASGGAHGQAQAIRVAMKRNARSNSHFNLIDERSGRRRNGRDRDRDRNRGGDHQSGRDDRSLSDTDRSKRDNDNDSRRSDGDRERNRDRSSDQDSKRRKDDDDDSGSRSGRARTYSSVVDPARAVTRAERALKTSKLGRSIVAADVAAKVMAGEDRLAVDEMDTVKQDIQNTVSRGERGELGSTSFSSMNDGEIMNSLGIKGQSNLSDPSVVKKVDTLSKLYDPKNREKIASSLSEGLGIDKKTAYDLFDKRQREVKTIRERMHGGFEKRLDSMLASSKKQLEQLEKQISGERISPNSNGRMVSSAQGQFPQNTVAFPVATPSGSVSNISSGRQGTSRQGLSSAAGISVADSAENSLEASVEVETGLEEDSSVKADSGDKLDKKKSGEIGESVKKEVAGKKQNDIREKRLSYKILSEMIGWLGEHVPAEKSIKAKWKDGKVVSDPAGEEVKVLSFKLEDKLVEVYRFSDGKTHGFMKSNGDSASVHLKTIDFSSFF